MNRLEQILSSMAEDRQKMNAAYSVYKDYSDRVKSWESQLHGELTRLSEPLSDREKQRLHDIIEGKVEIPQPKPITEQNEPF